MGTKTEYTASTLRICIDEMKTAENDIKGRIYGVAAQEEAAFSDSSEFFVLIDRILDAIGKPQSSRRCRSFRETEAASCTSYQYRPVIYHSSDEIREYTGKVLTRDVTFISRLRSSWQGIMKDEDGNLIGHFDSDLEFIALLYDHGVTKAHYNKG